MSEIKQQDAQAKPADAATVKLGLNKETLRDLDVPAASDVNGGFIMKDSIIVRTGR